MEKLELARIFQELSDEDKEDFCLASNESFEVRKEYIKYSEEYEKQESVDYTSKLVQDMIEGIEAEKKVYRFHKWLITTMNSDLPPIDDLTENEIEIEKLNEKLNIVKGNIAIQTAMKKNVEELK